jgi:hypothetical protein
MSVLRKTWNTAAVMSDWTSAIVVAVRKWIDLWRIWKTERRGREGSQNGRRQRKCFGEVGKDTYER